MPETRYFHGGPAEIRLLEWIQPPNITGRKSSSEYGSTEFQARVRMVHSKDRVYVTTNSNAAALFAAAYPQGAVFEVRPVGDLEPDPDCSLPGLSYACLRAQVLRRRILREDERLQLVSVLLATIADEAQR